MDYNFVGNVQIKKSGFERIDDLALDASLESGVDNETLKKWYNGEITTVDLLKAVEEAGEGVIEL